MLRIFYGTCRIVFILAVLCVVHTSVQFLFTMTWYNFAQLFVTALICVLSFLGMSGSLEYQTAEERERAARKERNLIRNHPAS